MLEQDDAPDPAAQGEKDDEDDSPRLSTWKDIADSPGSPGYRIQTPPRPRDDSAADAQMMTIHSPRSGRSSDSSEAEDDIPLSPRGQSPRPDGGSPSVGSRLAVPVADVDCAGRHPTPRTKHQTRAKDGGNHGYPAAKSKGGRSPAFETNDDWEFDLLNALPREKALALLDIIESADRRKKRGDYNAEHFEGKLREMMATVHKTFGARFTRMMQEVKEMNDQMRVEMFNTVKAGAESQRQASVAFEGRMRAQFDASGRSLRREEEQKSGAGRIEEVPEDTSKGEAAATPEGSAEVISVQELKDLGSTFELELRSSSISSGLEAERTERSKEIAGLTKRMVACEEVAWRMKRLIEKQAEQLVGRKGREPETPRGQAEDPEGGFKDLYQALDNERAKEQHSAVLAKLQDERRRLQEDIVFQQPAGEPECVLGPADADVAWRLRELSEALDRERSAREELERIWTPFGAPPQVDVEKRLQEISKAVDRERDAREEFQRTCLDGVKEERSELTKRFKLLSKALDAESSQRAAGEEMARAAARRLTQAERERKGADEQITSRIQELEKALDREQAARKLGDSHSQTQIASTRQDVTYEKEDLRSVQHQIEQTALSLANLHQLKAADLDELKDGVVSLQKNSESFMELHEARSAELRESVFDAFASAQAPATGGGDAVASQGATKLVLAEYRDVREALKQNEESSLAIAKIQESHSEALAQEAPGAAGEVERLRQKASVNAAERTWRPACSPRGGSSTGGLEAPQPEAPVEPPKDGKFSFFGHIQKQAPVRKETGHFSSRARERAAKANINPDALRVMVDTMLARFPHKRREDVEADLRKHGGHAGQIAREYKKELKNLQGGRDE